MNFDICLVSCGKKKRKSSGRAQYLYISPLFSKYRQFAREYCNNWYILSAKYGLLEPDELVEPYDKTLKTMSAVEREHWAWSVFQDLKSRSHRGNKIIIFAGNYYRERFIPLLSREGYEVLVPLEGRPLGIQLRWFKAVSQDKGRMDHLERFYSLIRKLEQGLREKRLLGECTGYMDWPERGVYFLFEPGEMRTLIKSDPRIVRVGTHMVSHGSKATLWNRLRTHCGTNEGGGNHRGSIFRSHVGAALINRDHSESYLSTWGKGSTASASIRKSEVKMEHEVSDHIRRMSVLWLKVPDEPGPTSDRAYIERNCISLLSGPWGPIDLPSKGWLGNHCPNERVMESGLWNVAFTDFRYDSHFLDILEEYVKVTLGIKPSPQASIALPYWYHMDTRHGSRQLKLLLEEDF